MDENIHHAEQNIRRMWHCNILIGQDQSYRPYSHLKEFRSNPITIYVAFAHLAKSVMEIKYRCKQTIDLEDFIMGFEKQETHKSIEAIVHYKSGRTERFMSLLNKDQRPRNDFRDRMKALSEFPTVTKIEYVKHK